MKLTIDSTYRTFNDVEIPRLGLGVWQIGRGEPTITAVRAALDAGYRHIDTAAAYGNEDSVGEAIRESAIRRQDIFVTTKLWNDDHGHDAALAAFDKSLARLGLEYVDLYLIHWPVEEKRKESWSALEYLFKEGRARAIGVSNYTIRHLEELMDSSDIVPHVNQVEFHPFLYQSGLLEFCNDNEIALEAYSPLTHARRLDDPRIGAVAKKLGRTNAQVLIRWALQHGTIVLPKSSNPERIRENANVFDFEIGADDMKALDDLNEDARVAWDPTGVT
ncbi:aldo/keto reductase [bacterium]|nr:aldo/keto reductase [bacterium]